MAISIIKDLLRKKMGLNASTVGSSNFERAVRHRMNFRGIVSDSEYLNLLNSSEEELKELIEEVVIPETWFFRNHESFSALDEYVTQVWLKRPEQKKFRILSIPCSTGEEPYTISMVLDGIGLKPNQYHIDAIDISTRLLIHAKRGLYSKHSFRNKDNSFREKYFTLNNGKYLISDAIKSSVHFQFGNLMDRYFGTGRKKYDVIFCRNLLIYFDRPTQQDTIAILSKLLHDDGLLFLGHAEIGDFINDYYKRADYPKAFAYIKFNQEEIDSKRNRSVKNRLNKPHEMTKNANLLVKKTVQSTINNEANFVIYAETQDKIILREITKLTNAGEFDKAGEKCEKYLESNSTSAQAYYMLGLIREAQGQENQVEGLFRKAMYLDPNHHEAIVHLALHAGKKGDVETAKKLHERAQRVMSRRKLIKGN